MMTEKEFRKKLSTIQSKLYDCQNRVQELISIIDKEELGEK